MGNQEGTVQPGKKRKTSLRGEKYPQVPPAAVLPPSGSSQRKQVQLCAATKYACLTGALKDEVSVWTATATKRHIDSIWIQEQALVACCCFLHMQAVSASQAAAGEGAAVSQMSHSGTGHHLKKINTRSMWFSDNR